MNKLFAVTLLAAAWIWPTLNAHAARPLVSQDSRPSQTLYPNSLAPLAPKPYIELPLGSIKARGWLFEMLDRQRKGATGQMDTLYPEVMGPRNGWLGGDGDQWERGPYWIDGLLPLAYLLDDNDLKKKVQPWIEWTLKSQRSDGYFGPAKDYSYEPGLQRDNSADWWPRMVLLKIMQQYYSATSDKRVIDFMTRYFRYQLAQLPKTPLGHWTFWATYRGGDNLQAVYWLYNITGDKFLLELADIIHKQTHDFTHMFLETDDLQRFNTIHCVNLAQGLKEPVIYYQHHHDRRYLDAVKKGLADIRRYNGQAQGMFGGDENLHGNDHTQGSELCSAVELMFSLEKMIEITGDIAMTDHLERIAFNALPTQVSDDFMHKQYFQQPNQVTATRHGRNFYVNFDHSGTDIVFGSRSGFPCCFSNMHQGWPKFVQSLWYATPDGGLAAMAYSPSAVTARVAGGTSVTIEEQTVYPMDDLIMFDLHIADKKAEAAFPLHLRVPGWCHGAIITVNGEPCEEAKAGSMAVINRTWKDGDRVMLRLPMRITTSEWTDAQAVAVERGPLVYALKMEEKWEKKTLTGDEKTQFGDSYYEVTSSSPWNYALLANPLRDPNRNCSLHINPDKQHATYFWNVDNAPIEIRVKAKRIDSWQMYNGSAGPLPFSTHQSGNPVEEITLIPYGCTTLRISEFPTVW